MRHGSASGKGPPAPLPSRAQAARTARHQLRSFRVGMTSADDSGMKEYVRRAINYDHMDFEYTFWQMFYLCVAPARV